MSCRTLRLLLGALSLVLTCSAMADDHPRVDANKINTQTAKGSITANGGSSSEFGQFPEKIESKYLVFYSAIPHAQLLAYAHFADMFLDCPQLSPPQLEGVALLWAQVCGAQLDRLHVLVSSAR